MTTAINVNKLEQVQQDAERFDELLFGLDCQTVALIIARLHDQPVVITGEKPVELLNIWFKSEPFLRRVFNECFAIKLSNGSYRNLLYKVGQGNA